jgi:hypothetical protein
VSGAREHTHKLCDVAVGPKGLFECDPGFESTDNTFSASKWSVVSTHRVKAYRESV